MQELRTALAAGRDATVVLLNYRKDGTPFWNQVAISPVRDDAGQLARFVGAQTDVTERVEADQRLALLAEATSLLAVTLDLDEAMDRLTHLLVRELADGMVLTLTAPPGAPARAFAQHRDANTDLLDHLLEQLRAADDPTLPGQQLPAEPQLVNGPATGPGPVSGSLREVWDVARTLGAASLMIVPLTARRHVLGTAALVRDLGHRPFNDADLGLGRPGPACRDGLGQRPALHPGPRHRDHAATQPAPWPCPRCPAGSSPRSTCPPHVTVRSAATGGTCSPCPMARSAWRSVT